MDGVAWNADQLKALHTKVCVVSGEADNGAMWRVDGVGDVQECEKCEC